MIIEHDYNPSQYVTTWAYCWRCGKKINPNNINEAAIGCHKRCADPYRYGIVIVKFDLPVGKQQLKFDIHDNTQER